MKHLTELSDYEKNRFSVCESLAKEYLVSKERQKCYRVHGTNMYSDGTIERTLTIPLTDEQVTEIKSKMIEVANKVYPELSITTWEEFEKEVLDLKDSTFWDELNSSRGPWNDLIACEAEEHEMIADYIDFDNVKRLYHFSAYVYDEEKGEMQGPYNYVEELTDDEYIFLLALQLSVREGFTYNSLFKIDPAFALKLNRTIEFTLFDIDRLGNQTKPFLIIFNELLEDAKILEDEAKTRLRIDI